MLNACVQEHSAIETVKMRTLSAKVASRFSAYMQPMYTPAAEASPMMSPWAACMASCDALILTQAFLKKPCLLLVSCKGIYGVSTGLPIVANLCLLQQDAGLGIHGQCLPRCQHEGRCIKLVYTIHKAAKARIPGKRSTVRHSSVFETPTRQQEGTERTSFLLPYLGSTRH